MESNQLGNFFRSMYVIVEFTDANEGGVALIHKTWMVNNNSCLWPSSKSQTKIDKAVRSGLEPDSSFKVYQCRVLYSSSKYIQACIMISIKH